MYMLTSRFVFAYVTCKFEVLYSSLITITCYLYVPACLKKDITVHSLYINFIVLYTEITSYICRLYLSAELLSSIIIMYNASGPAELEPQRILEPLVNIFEEQPH